MRKAIAYREKGLQALDSPLRLGATTRTRQYIPAYRRNLSRRLAKPALHNGAVQKACKRAFIAHTGTISTSIAIDWVYPRAQQSRNDFNRAVRRALVSIGALKIGRAKTIGSPWLWRLPDDDGTRHGRDMARDR